MFKILSDVVGLLILFAFMFTIFPAFLIIRVVYCTLFFGFELVEALVGKLK